MILTKQQTDWLKSAVNGTWQLNQQTGLVDVSGTVKVPKQTTQFPVKFGVVSGDFSCSNTQITSLEGAPSSIGGDFWCHNTQITSLEGAPSSVGGSFWCSNTQITSLEGAPSSIGVGFYCYNTNITSLQGAPSSIGADFWCSSTQITSLEGAPSSIGGDFWCHDTQITSLQGAPSSIGGSFYCAHSPFVKQHLLQVLRYPQIKKVNVADEALNALINKHLQGDRDVLACQDELIDAGFGDIARL